MPRTTCKRKFNKSKSKNKNNKSIKRNRKLRYKLRKLKGGAYFPEKDVQDDLTDKDIKNISLALLQLCTTTDYKIEITKEKYNSITKVNILNELAIPGKEEKYYLHKHNNKERKFRFITNTRYKDLNTPKFIYALNIDSRIKNDLKDSIFNENRQILQSEKQIKYLIDDGYADIFNEKTDETNNSEDIPFFDEKGDQLFEGYY